jgi:hypothetical protein
MLGQSLFGKVFGVVWFLIVFALAVRFAGAFIAWWSPVEPKAWAALLVIAGVAYFTNQGLIQGIARAASGASGVSMQASSSVSNAFFLGRPPMEIPDAHPRLPFGEPGGQTRFLADTATLIEKEKGKS